MIQGLRGVPPVVQKKPGPRERSRGPGIGEAPQGRATSIGGPFQKLLRKSPLAWAIAAAIALNGSDRRPASVSKSVSKSLPDSKASLRKHAKILEEIDVH
jgi:hypothetical protein